jgi:hypothetical protein
MVIKVLGKDDLNRAKFNSKIKELKELEEDVVNQIKVSLGMLFSLESLYDISNYIDELLENWEGVDIDEEEEEDD